MGKVGTRKSEKNGGILKRRGKFGNLTNIFRGVRQQKSIIGPEDKFLRVFLGRDECID